MRVRRSCAIVLSLALVAAACSDDDGGSPPSPTTAAPTDEDAPSTTAAADIAEPTIPDEPDVTEPEPELAPATFDVAGGTEQVTVTGADPGTELTVVDADAAVLATGTVDDAGALLFRELPGGVAVTVRSADTESEPITTMARDDHPDPVFYAEQRLVAPGFGYLTTRDGTTLSVTVWLPGPVDEGPYPTLVEYSGYTPSNPDSSGLGDLYNALGYAYVGVNMRGTGCSGGSFRYFEYAQSLDGYDLVEAVAAQPWVQDNRVGMVGVSYPGISQLFVAQTQPPSLAAITPLSVLDDSFNANLYPGGILNTGFAVEWTNDRVEQARPLGQQWAADRIDAGDEECEANQGVRLQNPDLLGEIRDNPFWTSPLGDELAPRTFVDQIEVPVFLAGAWQDEQTGGRFPTMLDRFTGTDHLYVSLVNGLHTESMSPGIITRLVEFLDLYVAERTPQLGVLQAVGPILGNGIFGTDDLAFAPDRFTDMSYEDALAAFESEPPVQVLFEQGAAEGFEALAPMARWVESFDSWPIPEAVSTEWYLDTPPDDDPLAPHVQGRLVEPVPTTTGGETSYLAVPDGVPATFYEGSSSAIWRTDVEYDWQANAPGTAASFATEPLTDDLVVIGSSVAQLWIRSNLGDTDLEVTISDIRPDGTEVMVQSGWLRASRRALDEDASSPLRPVHTQLESDAAPLPDGEFEQVDIEIFPFAHVFRAGSRVRLTVDAPGGNRAVWAFETISGGEEVTIAHDADHPSLLTMAVVSGLDVPSGIPDCGSLRGQPCRTFPPAATSD